MFEIFLFYFINQVFSESVLVLTECLLLPKPTDEYQLTLHIPKNVSHLLSSSRLMVWTLSPNAQIITDSILFLVEPIVKKKVCLLDAFIEINKSLNNNNK